MKKIIFFICVSSFLFCDEKIKVEKKTICLNMIVKNESKVIRRCLHSLKHLIDYWVIVDTGSTDGTQNIIREYMKDLPGELHERKWVNFELNRNQALDLAKDKADYLLFIDADEELVFEKDFVLPELEADIYCITLNYNKNRYQRVSLIKTSLDWKWEGVVHEIVQSKEAKTYTILKGVENLVRREGCRSQKPDIFLKDAELFEKALKENPNDERSVYYLGQSYLAANQYNKALEVFEKRAEMKKFDEEAYWSYLNIGLIYKIHEMENKFIEYMYKAFTCRPHRAEPLYYLANYYRKKGKYDEAYTLASLALRLSYPGDSMPVEAWIYEYGLLEESFRSACNLERYSDALLIYGRLSTLKNLPEHLRNEIDEIMKPIHKKIMEGMISGITAKVNKSGKASGDVGK